MRKIYLSLAEGISILCLILQSASAVAETSKPAANSFKPVATDENMSAASPTIFKVKGNDLRVQGLTPATSPLIAQTGTKTFPQKQNPSTDTSEDQATPMALTGATGL